MLNEYSKNSKNKFFVVDFQHFGLLNFFQCKILILMIPKMIMFKKNDPICVFCWFWPLWLLAKMFFFSGFTAGWYWQVKSTHSRRLKHWSDQPLLNWDPCEMVRFFTDFFHKYILILLSLHVLIYFQYWASICFSTDLYSYLVV